MVRWQISVVFVLFVNVEDEDAADSPMMLGVGVVLVICGIVRDNLMRNHKDTISIDAAQY